MQIHNAPSQSALLVLHQKGQERQSWPLETRETNIGRWPDNDIVIADRRVSRHHALIVQHDLHYLIQDLGSRNGTFVNGQRLKASRRLKDGDRIQVAPHFQFTFVDSEATVPVHPAEAKLRIDTAQRRVWIAGRELKPSLSPAQFALLELLNNETERVFSREEIAAAVWPDAITSGVSDDAIDSLIRRLRTRLAELDPEHDYILALRGHGFRLAQSA